MEERMDGLSHDTYSPEAQALEVLKEELASAKLFAARLLEERADKENELQVYQQAIFQRDSIIEQMTDELIGSDVKESVEDLEAILHQSLANIELERLEKRELEAVRERKDKEREEEISELKEAILLVGERAEESYAQLTMEVTKKLESGEWMTAEDLVQERALVVEIQEELERKTSIVSHLQHALELEKLARVKEIEMLKNLLHNKEDEEEEVEDKLHKVKKGVKERLVQISEEKSATNSVSVKGSSKEVQLSDLVLNHTGLALWALRDGREESKTKQLIEKLEEHRENALSMLYKLKKLVLSAHAETGELRGQVREMHMRLEKQSSLSLRLGEKQKTYEKIVKELQVQLEMHKEELERVQMQPKTERVSIEEWAEVADSLQVAIDLTNERMLEVTSLCLLKEDEAVQLREEVADLKKKLARNQPTKRKKNSTRTLESEQGRAAEQERSVMETLREMEITVKRNDRAEKADLQGSQIPAFQEEETQGERGGALRGLLTSERERMCIKEEQLAECDENWKIQKEKELRLLEQNIIELETKMDDLAKELTWERMERLHMESGLADRNKELCEERDRLAKEVVEERQKVMSLGSNMMVAPVEWVRG